MGHLLATHYYHPGLTVGVWRAPQNLITTSNILPVYALGAGGGTLVFFSCSLFQFKLLYTLFNLRCIQDLRDPVKRIYSSDIPQSILFSLGSGKPLTSLISIPCTTFLDECITHANTHPYRNFCYPGASVKLRSLTARTSDWARKDVTHEEKLS